MSTRTIIIVLIVIALGIFGVTLWFSLTDKGGEEVAPEPQAEEQGYIPQTITAKHQFVDGVHTIAGEVDVSTSCDLLETDSFVEIREPNSDRATVQFTTINESDVCAQVITTVRFKESFNAGENAEIIATWNGHSVPLNLIDVGPEEDLENFELYIKG